MKYLGLAISVIGIWAAVAYTITANPNGFIPYAMIVAGLLSTVSLCYNLGDKNTGK